MIIERDIMQSFERWRTSGSRRSPLVLQGARQIGKSWAVEEFGRRSYKHVAVFNFDKNKDLCGLFARTADVGRLLGELSLYTAEPLIAGETLLFFDEIQDCREALNALKYFKEDAPEHHVIAAGSLLGVATRRADRSAGGAGNTFPVGKVTFMDMYPVTFREYLRMAEPALYGQVGSWLGAMEPLPEVLFSRLSEHYRRFQMCGGLPRPCSDMLDGEGMATIEADLADLRRAYEFDFTKHVDAKDIPRIHEIWRSLPSQLSRENRKFVFRTVREGARAREYEAALDWLVLSGMVYRVHCATTPMLPLKHYEDTTAFKVYMLDQAILRLMTELPAEAVATRNGLLREFKGAMAENFVLGSLLAQGFKLPHYWTLQGGKAEVDFLVQEGMEIIPIEVKAEDNVAGKSLAEYDRRYSPRIRLRLSMRNLRRSGNLVDVPLFLCDWLRELLPLL